MAFAASSRLLYSSSYDDLTSSSDATHHFRKLGHLTRQQARGADPSQRPPEECSHRALFSMIGIYESMIRVADVLPVESNTSSNTVAQTWQQLDGLACMTWKTVEQDDKLERAVNI